MKLAIRIFALTLVVAGTIAGNSMPRNTTIASAVHAAVPAPAPTCNPWQNSNCNIRNGR